MTAIAVQTQPRSKTRTAVTMALIGALSVSLCACETIERETGFNRSTRTGAAAGAAFGGIVAALASASRGSTTVSITRPLSTKPISW